MTLSRRVKAGTVIITTLCANGNRYFALMLRTPPEQRRLGLRDGLTHNVPV